MGEAQQPERQQASEPAGKPAAAVPDGPSLAPSYQQVLSLQRSAGNAAVSRALSGARPADIGVKASDQLWYFNGETQSEHPTQIKLSAEANTVGRFLWDVVDGQERAELAGSGGPNHAESQTDNGVNLLSRSGSEGQDDVRVRVSHFDHGGQLIGTGEQNLGVRTPAGTASAGRTTVSAPAAEPVGGDGPAQGTGLEERDANGEIAGGEGAAAGGQAAAPPTGGAPEGAPKSLRHDGTSHTVDATWAYSTYETYTVLDDKGTPIKGFDVNEAFGPAAYDAPGADWRQSVAGGHHSGTTTFSDHMGGESAGHTPTPQNPQTPLGSTKVQHWDQKWYIGSTTPGKGTLVQTNLFQKYRDHANHENIKSPP